MKESTSQNIFLASCFALIAASMFAITGLFVKLIGNDLPTSIVVFSRFSIALILLIPWFLKDKKLFKVVKPLNFFFRSLTSLLSLACLFFALKYVSLADGLLLNNTNALFVPMAAWLLLGTRTPVVIWLITLLGFIGVALVLHPDQGIFQSASLIGLASGLLGGLSLVQLRQLTKTNTAQQILFYYFVISSILTGAMLIFFWKTPTWHLLFLLCGVGVSGAIYQYFVLLSFTYAPVRFMSTVMFISILVGAFFDWLLWHHVPSTISLIGMMLIILASVGSVFVGQQYLSQKSQN